MTNCPLCQAQLEISDKNLGAIFTCPHCRGVYYINWDGQPEVAQHEAEPPAAEPAVSEEFVPAAPQEFVPFEPPAESSFEAPPDFAPPFEARIPQEAPISEEPLAVDAPTFESPIAEESYQESIVPFQPEDNGFSAEPMPSPQEGGVFAEIEAYANAEPAAGPLSYTLRIEGLELAETFEALREALSDSRFGWESADIMSSITKDGVLVLKNLNPTKAAILVGRIKYLPVRLSWEQGIFAGGENELDSESENSP